MRYKISSILIFLFLGLFLFSCNTAAERREDSLINRWKMVKFLQNDKDASARFNPKEDRMIQFKEDGSYYAEGGPFPPTSGNYTLSVDTLNMISNEGPSENASWIYKINKDKMTFRRINSNMPFRTEIHYEIE